MGKFLSTLNGKKIALIGAGVSHRELLLQFSKAGAAVTLCDQRTQDFFKAELPQWQQLDIRLHLGANYLLGLEGQDMILRTPGFRFHTPELQQAAQSGSEITSEMELFFQHCPCKIVGITGSDGKTTTTSLIAEMYKANGHTVHLGGNIGRPLLPIVDTISTQDIAVVELSSFQLISMRCSPNIAVVTNLTPNHLDQHKDMAEYIDAKRNILAWQQATDQAILGFESPIVHDFESDVKGSLRWFSHLREVDSGAFLSEDGALCLAKDGHVAQVISSHEVALRGQHNIQNLLAAFAAVQGDVPMSVMRKVAAEFSGVPHRLEPVRTLEGVQWFNDSIATSPTRVIAALNTFNQKIIVIAGGYDKNIPFAPLAPHLLAGAKALVLTGPTASKISAAVKAEPSFTDTSLPILYAADLPDAVLQAKTFAQNGDIVVLSPASASFDAYSNFEARGEHFKELVNAL